MPLYLPLTPLNPHLVPPRGWGGVGCGVLSGMIGGYETLTLLNPHLVPPRRWGGVWGTLRNVWWVSDTDSSKPSPCTPKGVGWGVGYSQECLVGMCHDCISGTVE